MIRCLCLLFIMLYNPINMMNYNFFFFKQKTAYDMRISDWSSDVCSSDLLGEALQLRKQREIVVAVLAEAEARIDHEALLFDARHLRGEDALGQEAVHVGDDVVVARGVLHRTRLAEQIGRASCRERVCQDG